MSEETKGPIDDTPTDPGVNLGADDVARLFDKLNSIERQNGEIVKSQKAIVANMDGLLSAYQQQALTLAQLQQNYAQLLAERQRSPSEELRAVGKQQ
jgi:hypothetical protein